MFLIACASFRLKETDDRDLILQVYETYFFLRNCNLPLTFLYTSSFPLVSLLHLSLQSKHFLQRIVISLMIRSFMPRRLFHAVKESNAKGNSFCCRDSPLKSYECFRQLSLYITTGIRADSLQQELTWCCWILNEDDAENKLCIARVKRVCSSLCKRRI